MYNYYNKQGRIFRIFGYDLCLLTFLKKLIIYFVSLYAVYKKYFIMSNTIIL